MSNEGFLRRWSRLKGGRDGLPCPPAGQEEQRANSDLGHPPQASANFSPGLSPSLSPGASLNADLRTAPNHDDLAGAHAAEATLPVRTALPTLEDAMRLTAESDYSAFMAQGVDKAARRMAMKKLFADPHFSQLDGLDIYMGDYNRADPLPASMLAALRQAQDFIQQAPADEEHAGAQDEPEAAVAAAGAARKAGMPCSDKDGGMQEQGNREKGEEA
jgi:hypothetical protein